MSQLLGPTLFRLHARECRGKYGLRGPCTMHENPGLSLLDAKVLFTYLLLTYLLPIVGLKSL